MKTLICTGIAAISLLLSGSAFSDVMFARSSGAFKAFSKPGKFSALNLLDGDKATVWCSEGTGQDAKIHFQFSERTQIDKVEITMGNQKSMTTFRAFNRVRALEFLEGDMSHPKELADKPGVQTLHFDPSLETDGVTIRLKSGYRGEQYRRTCISDVIFYRGRKALSSKKDKKAIRKARKKIPFMDTWVSGPEMNKTHQLIFGLNENYRLQYVPHDPTEDAIHKKGKYRIKGGDPQIQVDRKWIPVKVKRDDAGRVLKLKLVGLDSLDGVYIRRANAPAH